MKLTDIFEPGKVVYQASGSTISITVTKDEPVKDNEGNIIKTYDGLAFVTIKQLYEGTDDFKVTVVGLSPKEVGDLITSLSKWKTEYDATRSQPKIEVLP